MPAKRIPLCHKCTNAVVSPRRDGVFKLLGCRLLGPNVEEFRNHCPLVVKKEEESFWTPDEEKIIDRYEHDDDLLTMIAQLKNRVLFLESLTRGQRSHIQKTEELKAKNDEQQRNESE